MNAINYADYIRKLKSVEISHRNYEDAKRAVYAHASLATPGSVIAFVGPTRGGKTTICHYLQSSLVKQCPSENPDNMPLVVVEASNVRDGLFSMKHFTLRALDAIRHPIFRDVGATDESKEYFPRVQLSETYLRIALEKGLLARHTLYLFVDEAAHLVMGRQSRRASEVLDSLKCLCNTTNVVLILIGGYALLPNLFASPHLNGRMTVVSLKDYKNTRVDREEFARLLVTIDSLMPLRNGASLLEYEDALFAGSLGLCGLLIKWLEAAICAMAADDARYLNKRYLSGTRLEQQITVIQEEIAMGDALLAPHDVRGTSVPPADGTQAKSSKKRTPAFRRKPTRDPVGPINPE